MWITLIASEYTVDCGDYVDYWYFGPYGLLIEWIIAYRDYVYSRLLGFCGLWELGSCGLCGLWVQWLIGIMYTVACGDYGYFRPCGLWIEWIMYTVDYGDYVDYWYFGPCGLCGLWMHRGLCGVAPQNALAFIPC